jgi:hypothetical protein
VLAAAVILQLSGAGGGSPHPHEVALASLIPETVPGWKTRDVPLGSTEFLSNEVEKVLNFDEAVSREFSRGGESFGLYVVYWSAGKMPVRLVASHTPDRCWTESGWRCLAMKFKQQETLDGVPLQPAEWRLFSPPVSGPPVYVLYWHLVDGRTYDFGGRFNSIPDPMRWWKDVFQQAALGNREQYFIRLTSTQPLENLWSDPGFAAVLRSLGHLGLLSKGPEGLPN